MWVSGWRWPKAIPVLSKFEAALGRKQGRLEGGWTLPSPSQGAVYGKRGSSALPRAIGMLQFSGAALCLQPCSLPPLRVPAPQLDTALLGWEGDILQQPQNPIALERRNGSVPSLSPHCILLFSSNEANIIISR